MGVELVKTGQPTPKLMFEDDFGTSNMKSEIDVSIEERHRRSENSSGSDVGMVGDMGGNEITVVEEGRRRSWVSGMNVR